MEKYNCHYCQTDEHCIHYCYHCELNICRSHISFICYECLKSYCINCYELNFVEFTEVVSNGKSCKFCERCVRMLLKRHITKNISNYYFFIILWKIID